MAGQIYQMHSQLCAHLGHDPMLISSLLPARLQGWRGHAARATSSGAAPEAEKMKENQSHDNKRHAEVDMEMPTYSFTSAICCFHEVPVAAGRCGGGPSMVMMGLGPSFLRFLMVRLVPSELVPVDGAGASFWVLSASASLPLIAADAVVAPGRRRVKGEVVRRRWEKGSRWEKGKDWFEGEAELGIDSTRSGWQTWSQKVQVRCAWLMLSGYRNGRRMRLGKETREKWPL